MLALSEGDSKWGDVEHLIADAIDVLQAANWQRQGDKKAERPKPHWRPHLLRERRARDEELTRRVGALQRLRERTRKGRDRR